MSECVLESGYLSVNKRGEELCGDHVEIKRKDNGEQLLVLADGLGSGVRANILATLTSSMLSTMIDGGLSLKESVESLTRTLPVATDRGNVAYSTLHFGASSERQPPYLQLRQSRADSSAKPERAEESIG
jgi:serine phosphatase RsbU (regulator of sigma subunit)